jgi:hypothetical protein
MVEGYLKGRNGDFVWLALPASLSPEGFKSRCYDLSGLASIFLGNRLEDPGAS